MWQWLLKLSRFNKQLLLIASDGFLFFLALYLSVSLRYETFFVIDSENILVFLITPFLSAIVFKSFGIYRFLIRYLSYESIWLVVKATAVVVLLWTASLTLYGAQIIPRSTAFVFFLMALLATGGVRVLMCRYFTANIKHSYSNQTPVAIYGAGESGRQLCALLKTSREFKPVLFIDDDVALKKSTIYDLKVYSQDGFLSLWQKQQNSSGIFAFLLKKITHANAFEVRQFILAMPSVSYQQLDAISQYLMQFNLPIKTLPSIQKWVDGRPDVHTLKDISIEDLLVRQDVKPDLSLLQNAVEGKKVLVTGAGGSIGAQLCLEIAKQKPKTIVLYELSEVALYQVEQALKTYQTIEIVAVLANVGDEKKLSQTLKQYQIAIVFHAAAYKHVPLVEDNPFAAVENNILASYVLAKAVSAAGVSHCLLVSTDKAVRPTNIMGASKRFAEMIFQSYQALDGNKTIFSMVRFGNVLASSGSVVPLFKNQIDLGGPVTVTHQDITRYFMTIPEAAQLVIQAAALASGGEVFVLDMGEPIKIIDLAKKMIHFSGRKNINIEITGLRPGEKLYEELLIQGKEMATKHPKIKKANEQIPSMKAVEKAIKDFQVCLQKQDIAQLKQLFVQTNTGYHTVDH